MRALQQEIVRPPITRISRMFPRCSHGSMSRLALQRLKASTLQRSNTTDSISHQLPVRRSLPTRHSSMRRLVGRGGSATNQSSGFALVIALVMVALMAVVAVGVFTSVSRERVTATSYNDRYRADLAAQTGLQAAAKTLAAAPFPSPVPGNFNTTVTGNDAFLVVRAYGPADANNNIASYYYLAQPTLFCLHRPERPGRSDSDDQSGGAVCSCSANSCASGKFYAASSQLYTSAWLYELQSCVERCKDTTIANSLFMATTTATQSYTKRTNCTMGRNARSAGYSSRSSA